MYRLANGKKLTVLKGRLKFKSEKVNTDADRGYGLYHMLTVSTTTAELCVFFGSTLCSSVSFVCFFGFTMYK